MVAMRRVMIRMSSRLRSGRSGSVFLRRRRTELRARAVLDGNLMRAREDPSVMALTFEEVFPRPSSRYARG